MCFSTVQDKFRVSVTEKFKTRLGEGVRERRTAFARCFHIERQNLNS